MKLFKLLALLFVTSSLTGLGANNALAGSFPGTYVGKTIIKIDGVRTACQVTLVMDSTSAKITLTHDGTPLDFDVRAFVDHRGAFFGLLSQDDVIIAGVGGRINGHSKHSRVVGRFLQEDYSHPFVLKKVEEEPAPES